ncbi:hypothetical protein G4B88_008605 [Cannabis sativa]|uniref:Uncharacterized protein n=1 Tax=Cannabis sativa TaxID=3483 RepID=A0A7J6FC77_CANSA|nr:hypothetical protein G4B88_008605 [Cannabis sativa]
MKESIDSKTVRVIDSTSLNMLTISTVSCSFLRELRLHLFSMALRTVFFTTFLEAKNFLISLVRLISPPLFLRKIDLMSKFNAASALVNSFDSLASSAPTLLVFIILVTNDQLMNESNDSKTATAIDSNSLNMLTVSLLTCSFLRELKLLLFSKALRSVFFITFLEAKNFLISLVIDVEDEASAEDLNMPSNSEIRGCCLEGKLLDRTTASTLANSFTTSSSQPTLLLCTSLETRDQPPSLDCVFGPEIKDNKDSNAARVTASTSLKTLTKAAVSLSLVEVEATYFDSTPFKLFKAFWIAFLTTFLEAELLSDFLTFLAVMSKFNAASALVNSFDSLTSSADTLFVFIIFVTNDQLLLDFGPEMNESNDSKTATAIDSNSLNMLTVSLLTCSFLRELKLLLFSKALPKIKDNKDSSAARVTASTSLITLTKAEISLLLVALKAKSFDSTPFKLFKAFWIAFFTTFLEAEYFLISLSRLTFLRMLFDFDDFDSETKDTIDSKTLKVINSTSLNMLTISGVSCSFLTDEVLNLDLFSMALESAFFIIFLQLKNFLTSLERLISPPYFFNFWPTKIDSATSTLANLFDSITSSQHTFFEFFITEANDHLFDFDSEFCPVMNEIND